MELLHGIATTRISSEYVLNPIVTELSHVFLWKGRLSLRAIAKAGALHCTDIRDPGAVTWLCQRVSVMIDEVFTAVATSTLVTLIGVLVVGAALAFHFS